MKDSGPDSCRVVYDCGPFATLQHSLVADLTATLGVKRRSVEYDQPFVALREGRRRIAPLDECEHAALRFDLLVSQEVGLGAHDGEIAQRLRFRSDRDTQ